MKKTIALLVVFLVIGTMSLSTVIIGDGFLLGFGRHANNDVSRPVESFFGVSWGLGMRYQSYFGQGLTAGLNTYWGIDTILLLVPNKINLGVELALSLGTNSYLNLGGSIGFSFLGIAQYLIPDEWLHDVDFNKSPLYLVAPGLHLAIVF